MDKRYSLKLRPWADQIIEAYKNYLSAEEIAQVYNVTATTVIRLLKRYGVEIRRKGPVSWEQFQQAEKAKKKILDNVVYKEESTFTEKG